MFINFIPLGTRTIARPPASPPVPDLPFWRRRGLNGQVLRPHPEISTNPALPAWTAQGGLAGTIPTFLAAPDYEWTPEGDAGALSAGTAIDGFTATRAVFDHRWVWPGNEGTNQSSGNDQPASELRLSRSFIRSTDFVARLQLLVRPVTFNAADELKIELLATDAAGDRYSVGVNFAMLNGAGTVNYTSLLDYGQGQGTDAGGTPPYDDAMLNATIDKHAGDYFAIVIELPVSPSAATSFTWAMTVRQNNDEHEVAAAVASFPSSWDANRTLSPQPFDTAIRQSVRWTGTRSTPAGLAILCPRPTTSAGTVECLSLSDGATTVTAHIDAAGNLVVGDGAVQTSHDMTPAWTASNAATPLAHWLDVHLEGPRCTVHLDGVETAELTLAQPFGALIEATVGPLDVEVVEAVLHTRPGYTDILQVALPADTAPLQSDWIVQHVEG